MTLNIKNPETVRLARALAERTGTSVTGAITDAVRAQLDRIGSGADEDALVARLLAIGRDCADRLDPETRTVDHGDLLYGDDGLPR